MKYAIGDSGQTLTFSDKVLKHFEKHRQTRWWKREAGGQLFARVALPEIAVELATGPRVGDRRSRFSYQPDRWSERVEIKQQNARGLVYIGDWHSHPEPYPTPSDQDTTSIIETFTKSRLGLQGLVLVIVGTQSVKDSLYVGVCDRSAVIRISARPEAPSDPGKKTRQPLVWI